MIAIGYAGLAATIWAAIVPALLAKASRQKFPNATYKVYGGNFMIGFVILFGVLNIVAQVGANLGMVCKFRRISFRVNIVGAYRIRPFNFYIGNEMSKPSERLR